MLTPADVTVAIVCDRVETLPRCFDGLMVQTTVPARILLIDNGCWPGITVDDYITQHISCPIDIVRFDTAETLSAARNSALEQCNTPLLAWLDPGIIPSPDWLELLTDAIAPRCHCLAEKAAKVCGVGGRVEYLDPAAGIMPPPRNQGMASLENPECLWHGNVIYKTEALRLAGGYPLDAAGQEDAELARNLYARNGMLLYIPAIKCAAL